MKVRILNLLAMTCITFAASNTSADVKIIIEQTPSEPMKYDSAINSCNDTWNRMAGRDPELKEMIISRFGSKIGYLKHCANKLVEQDEQKSRLPVKEVYCELEAYRKLIVAHYEELEGNYI